jgi:hypothetical protein
MLRVSVATVHKFDLLNRGLFDDDIHDFSPCAINHVYLIDHSRHSSDGCFSAQMLYFCGVIIKMKDYVTGANT